MNTRLKYQLRVLVNPALWLRNQSTDPEFDQWVWDALEHGDKPTIRSVHTAFFAGVVVWVSNAPYADGSLHQHDEPERTVSRSTALRLREVVAPLMQEHKKWAGRS